MSTTRARRRFPTLSPLTPPSPPATPLSPASTFTPTRPCPTLPSLDLRPLPPLSLPRQLNHHHTGPPRAATPPLPPRPSTTATTLPLDPALPLPRIRPVPAAQNIIMVIRPTGTKRTPSTRYRATRSRRGGSWEAESSPSASACQGTMTSSRRVARLLLRHQQRPIRWVGAVMDHDIEVSVDRGVGGQSLYD